MWETRMTNFPLLLLVGSMICIGWWNAFLPGMVFGWLGKIWDKRLPEVMQKPLYSCPPCLASTIGSAVWFTAGGSYELWLWYVLALSGVNRIIAGNLLK